MSEAMTPPTKGGLQMGPLGGWVHLCIDMQRMFAEDTEWRTPWMPRVLPNVVRVAELAPERTVFTRFIPPERPEQMGGTWRRYYERYRSMTRERLDPELLELVPELARFTPPGRVVDKPVYSPWHGAFDAELKRAGVGSLIVTGAETEVCVLAAVMGAIDLGYRVLVVTDAICSSADPTHDAMLEIYHSRYGMQVETLTTTELIAAKLDGALRAEP
jgi:nicotinamidase-related amidase